MKAKAWVLIEPNRLEPAEFEVGPPDKGQILVKMAVTSVCASDPKMVHGTSPFKAYPIILGHELSGEVAEIGPEAARAQGLELGDRITIEPTRPCGECRWCRAENAYHKCRPLRAYGVTMTSDKPPHLYGGYAEYMYLEPDSLVFPLAPATPHLAACLSTVIGNGVRWVDHLTGVREGESVVVSGAGAQGLASVIAAREAGAGKIAVLGLERDQDRFNLAREFGADFAVNIQAHDPREAVPDLMGGPPQVVVETSGVPSAIQTALELVAPLGRVAAIGLSGGRETPIRFDDLVAKGVRLAMDHAQAGQMKKAMEIINSGRYALEKINNVHYRLEDLPQALEDTAHPPRGFIKGAVVFD